MSHRVRDLCLGILLSLAAQSAIADSVTLPASRDNTLYEDASGALSNGAGEWLFVGRTAIDRLQRAVLAFDLAAALPDEDGFEAGDTDAWN